MQPSEQPSRARRNRARTRRPRQSVSGAVLSLNPMAGKPSRLPSPDAAKPDTDAGAAWDTPIRVGILLIRSQALLAGAIAVVLALDQQLRVVATETDPRSGPLRIVAADPDIVLVDSIPLVGQLRGMRPDLRVIVLGAEGDPQVALACVRAGAAGCVGAGTTAEALAGLIKAAHTGRLLYDADMLVSLLQRPHLPLGIAPRRTAKLGEREVEVLAVLARGLTSLEAADQLGISVHTLRTHVKNIVAKLEARSKLEAVLIAIREGRVTLPPDSDLTDGSI